jgi:glycine/D-amino acid oxidase-like deaminating enzyme
MAAADPTVYGASWYSANAVEPPARGPLTLELDVDVCVIGGGLAGLTVALEVARRGWSVAVLEARRIAWSASGRNTGFVLPGFAADPQALIDKVGRQHAKTLWAWSEAGVEYVRRTAHELKLPGVDLEENGWLQVSKTGDAKAGAQADLLTREFGAAAELWPAERVRGVLRSARYFSGVFFPKAFTINPLNYALGLAAAAEAAGARVFEETPVLEIDPAGVRKRITTPSARVRAGHVVLAGNVHIGGLMPELAGTLVPISSYIIATEPLGDALHDAVRFPGAVSDTEFADNHYRIVGGDRLMWSGRCTLWESEAQRYVRSLLADIRLTYPQLGEVKTEFAWTGTLGNTVHRMPQIGEMSPGVWLLSGFGGQGINTTAMGANIVAGAIVEGGQAWLLFRPFELVWAGGKLGRAAVQSYYWYFRIRERFEAWLAQRRRPVDLPDIGADPPAPGSAPSDPEPAKRRGRRRRKTKPAAEPNAENPVSAG